MTEKNRTILWAADPFHEKKQLQHSAAVANLELTKNLTAAIEQVYFWSNYLPKNVFALARDLFSDIYSAAQSGLRLISDESKEANRHNYKPVEDLILTVANRKLELLHQIIVNKRVA